MIATTPALDLGLCPELAPGALAGRRVGVALHPNVDYIVRGVSAGLQAAGCSVLVFPARSPDWEALRDCEVLMVCSAMRCDEAALARLPHLKGIAALATGTDSIDINAASQRRIPVAHSPTPENVTSMAEASVLLILSALYRLPRSIEQMRNGWRTDQDPYARTLQGKVVGLVGFGKIARAVAERINGWGVRLIAYSPSVPAADFPPWVQSVSKDELAATADVVSLHGSASLTSGAIVDQAFLSQLKPGAVLVNTARGALVDESALAHSLQSGTPAFAALDTFVVEPLDLDSPLRGLPNAMLTPHTIGHTLEVQESLVRQGLKNVCDLFAGRRPTYLKNPQALSSP